MVGIDDWPIMPEFPFRRRKVSPELCARTKAIQ